MIQTSQPQNQPAQENLLGMNSERLADMFEGWQEKPFRARQVLRWIHQRGIGDFDAMTDIAKPLRLRLSEQAMVKAPPVISDGTATDGTRKWLLDVGGGDAIETVFIPETNRGTLCISTQAGCAVNCRFCSTGKQGFSRNLGADEVLGQVWHAMHALQGFEANNTQTQKVISNVVYMGMGEPLQNYATTLQTLRVLLDDNAYGLSRRRVTVSTSGVVPMMDRLANDCPVALAVSLHAPNDALRDTLVPLNRKYPLAELMQACQRYLKHAPRDFITFEYVMLDGVNDKNEHAQQLLALVKDLPCKFNLIPFNPFPGSGLESSSRNRIFRFADALNAGGVVTTVRKTRGEDIDAACGQLAGEVQDRTRLNERTKQKHRSVVRLKEERS